MGVAVEGCPLKSFARARGVQSGEALHPQVLALQKTAVEFDPFSPWRNLFRAKFPGPFGELTFDFPSVGTPRESFRYDPAGREHSRLYRAIQERKKSDERPRESTNKNGVARAARRSLRGTRSSSAPNLGLDGACIAYPEGVRCVSPLG